MEHGRLLTKDWGLLDAADEILCHIFEYMDGKSLCAVQRTCRVVHGLVSGRDDMYWYTLCRSEWGISPEYLCVSDTRSFVVAKKKKTKTPMMHRSTTTSGPLTNKALYRAALQAIQKLTRQMLEEQCLQSMQRCFSLPMSTTKQVRQKLLRVSMETQSQEAQDEDVRVEVERC